MENNKNLSNLLKEQEKIANEELLGIEYIDEEDDGDVTEKPYDPDSIRINHKFFTVFDICRWMGASPPTITVKPSFQRNLVWNDRKKSLLIESLMLRIPIPSFYFYEDDDGHKYVIDGLQRLSTIFDYVNGEFSLSGLQYLTENCSGKKFHELDQKYISRIEDTQLSVNILDSRTPELVKFDVFTRINTGGVPLNPQEIRNVMASEGTMNLLLNMSKSKIFIEATRGAVKDIRMDAQELCLRFITFYRGYSVELKTPHKDRPIAKMLDESIIYLNKCSKDDLENYYFEFEKAMRKSFSAFGKAAFVKPGNKIINKPLFTSWAVTLAYSDYSNELLLSNQENLIMALSNALESDQEYSSAITSNTASKKNVDKQFNMVFRILEETLEC